MQFPRWKNYSELSWRCRRRILQRLPAHTSDWQSMTDGDGAAAFVPGHVTGFFSVHRADDPLRTGSRGAGVTLADGVTTEVVPSDETTVRLNGREVDVESVTRVLDALDATASVSAETNLPIGSGFGVSGAMALGVALAANDAFDRERSENDLVSVAHAAEVEAGTGLGDVVAQARGGVPVRVEPGAPGVGSLDGVPATGRIEYVPPSANSPRARSSGAAPRPSTTPASARSRRSGRRRRSPGCWRPPVGSPRRPTCSTARSRRPSTSSRPPAGRRRWRCSAGRCSRSARGSRTPATTPRSPRFTLRARGSGNGRAESGRFLLGDRHPRV